MSILESYQKFMEENSDPRTIDWWMMSGPMPLISLLISYLYFCSTFGRNYMRDRKPYDLKYVIMTYNVSQVLMSMFLVYEGLMGGWFGEYNFSCQPVDYSDRPVANRMAAAVWWYFLAKIIELLDTVFFVLRKKNNQVTFLHLYHHTMMPICAWIGVKFLPGGHGTLLGVINSFIHIIMYSYYFLAAMGPEVQKMLWWKKYLTRLQMVQFTIIFLHNGQLLMPSNTCNYPKVIAFLLTVNAAFFIYLFGAFYVRIYIKENARKHIKSTNGVSNNGVSQNGNTKNSGIPNGTAQNGASLNGTSHNGTSHNGVSHNGVTQNGIVQNGHDIKNRKITNGHIGNGHITNGFHNEDHIKSQ